MKKKLSYKQWQTYVEDTERVKNNKQLKQLGLPFLEPVSPTQLSIKFPEYHEKGYTDPLYRYDDDPDYFTTKE